MDFAKIIESKQPKKTIPDFRPGDTVKVYLKIVEGDKERIQAFEGIVISREDRGVQETFTIRRISYGIGVERKFFIQSPSLEKIELVKKGMVKRVKLYYLREKSRKEGRIKEKLEEELGVKEVLYDVKDKEALNDKANTKVSTETHIETKEEKKKETKKKAKKV